VGESPGLRPGPGRHFGWLRSSAIAIACVAIGYLARLGIDALIHGQVPFVTFYPAVVAAGLIGGVRSGVIAVIVATPLAIFAFDVQYPVATTLIWCTMSSIVAIAVGSVRELTHKLKAERDELERTRAKLELVVREQVHRARNTLSVLTALAGQSAQGATTVEEYRDRLIERVRALSAAYAMLSAKQQDAPLDLAEIIETALGPFRASYGGRLLISGGPSAHLAPSVGIPLTLCLNELATNAVKYGALGEGKPGSVACDWSETSPGHFLLRWRERDGPEVATPTRTGFGSRMIEAALRGVPGGKAELRFAPNGVECDLAFEGFREAAPPTPPTA
jgi:two-component sensor histidine kinase